MYCSGLSLRCTVSIYQKLPVDFEQTIVNSQYDTIEEKLKYVLTQIGNDGERELVFFDKS